MTTIVDPAETIDCCASIVEPDKKPITQEDINRMIAMQQSRIAFSAMIGRAASPFNASWGMI